MKFYRVEFGHWWRGFGSVVWRLFLPKICEAAGPVACLDQALIQDRAEELLSAGVFGRPARHSIGPRQWRPFKYWLTRPGIY